MLLIASLRRLKMFRNELLEMIKVSKMAREEILKVYHSDFAVEIKSDDSPVTQADKNSDKLIREYLHEKFPSYAFLTEESNDDVKRLTNDLVFIVDPLDGTADFCAKNDEFTINIALSYQHQIVAAVIMIPVSGDIYYAEKGFGAYHLYPDNSLKRIHVDNKDDDLVMYTSRFHPSEQEKLLPLLDKRIKTVEKRGSSLKGCFIAEGKGEIHYRLNEGTKEWDIAPMDLIVKEAGGVFIKPDLTSYQYNKVDVYNHNGYIIANKMSNIYPAYLKK